MTVMPAPVAVPARSAAAPRQGGGWLRFVTWLIPERGIEGHAYSAADRVVTRSLCTNANWSVKCVPVVDAPLCAICVAIVRGAVAGMTAEIEDLEARIPETERRAMGGDR